MAGIALADTGFIVALLRHRDVYGDWARSQALEHPPPWHTCEAVFSEAFHLLDSVGSRGLTSLIRRGAVVISFQLAREQQPVLAVMEKYADVPMGLADACLVRMTETYADSVVLTTDSDFRVYRRHSRQVVPCVMPPAS